MLIVAVLIVVGAPLYFLCGKIVNAVNYMFCKLIYKSIINDGGEYCYDPNAIEKILWPIGLFFLIVTIFVNLLVLAFMAVFNYWIKIFKWCWR